MGFLPSKSAVRRDGWKYITYKTAVRHLAVGGVLLAALFAFSLARRHAGAPSGLDVMPQLLWIYIGSIATTAVLAFVLARSYIRWNDQVLELHWYWRSASIVPLADIVGLSKGLGGSVSLKVASADNILISRFADGILEFVDELSRRLSASGLQT